MTLPELADCDQVRTLLGDPRHTDMFTLAYLELCVAIYQTAPDDIEGIRATIESPNHVAPFGGCRWDCRWGPSYDADQANLAVIATAVRIADGKPLLNVVVIRGTDMIDKLVKYRDWGDLEQIAEDLLVGDQLPVPWLSPDDPAKLSVGSVLGWSSIYQLTHNGATIRAFLAESLTGPPQDRPTIAVTGHSLGGCLTSVMAPWLASEFWGLSPRPLINATSFAGPSAGNPPYAKYATSKLASFRRYYNTLDVIPNWWARVRANDSIYARFGLATPGWIIDLNDWFASEIPEYAQPGTGYQVLGAFKKSADEGNAPHQPPCPEKDLDWYQEAAYQHHATTYLELLSGLVIVPPPDPAVGSTDRKA